MSNTRTYVHDEHTIVDAKGNEIVMFHKNSVDDVVMDFKSKITAKGKLIFSAVCSTGGNVRAKVVNAPGYAMVDGAHLTVKFNEAITVSAATLNVNNTGAKPILLNGLALPAGIVMAGNWIILKYNGGSFDVVGGAGSTQVKKDNAKQLYLIGQNDANLNGVPATEYYNTNVYIDATGRVLRAPFFEGDGSKLQNLNATSIKTGTLSSDRLPNSPVAPGSFGPSSNATLGFGDSFTIPYTTVDSKGRITAISNKTLTMPRNPNTDSNVVTSMNNNKRMYLTGADDVNTAARGLFVNMGIYVNDSRLYAPTMQTDALYLGGTSNYITSSYYTGQAASVSNTGFATQLEDSLSSTATNKAATANAARKLSAGITSLIGQLGTQATFSLVGTTLYIVTKDTPYVPLA